MESFINHNVNYKDIKLVNYIENNERQIINI